MAEKSPLERLQETNADNKRLVTVSVGVFKAARREINAHVSVNAIIEGVDR